MNKKQKTTKISTKHAQAKSGSESKNAKKNPDKKIAEKHKNKKNTNTIEKKQTRETANKNVVVGSNKKDNKKTTSKDQKAVEYKEKPLKEPRKTTTRANKERFYVTNAGLMAELIKWRKSAKNVEDRMPSEELGRMVMAIAQKICNHSFFRNYTKEIKEDMMQYAFYKIFSGLKNYNFNYKNPFAYISQGIFNAYRSELTRHYKQVNIKKAMTEKVIRELEADLPGSSIEKCLSKQYGVGDNDEPF